MKTCMQCGRQGTRGFTELEPIWDEQWECWTPLFVLCSNITACRKRWPRQPDYDE